MATRYPHYVFDAYGTLFDVHSAVSRFRDRIGPQADSLSQMWRVKQLEYSWVLSLMGAYRPFRVLTAQALDFAAAQHGGLDAGLRQDLLEAYDHLKAYADVVPVLTALKAGGARLSILSNGSPDMLSRAVAAAGLGALLDDVISVDEVQVFKTDARVYALAERFGHRGRDIAFQSSNRWDVAAAVRFGWSTHWINRTRQPEEYADFTPLAVLADLHGLL